LRQYVLDSATEQYKSDTSNGSDMQCVSQLLQSKLQTVVMLDAALPVLNAKLSSGNVQTDPVAANRDASFPPPPPSLGRTESGTVSVLYRSNSFTSADLSALSPGLPLGVSMLPGADDSNLDDLDHKGLLRWLPEGLGADMETFNARRGLRRGPLNNAESGVYCTSMSKYGYEEGEHRFNVKVVSYQSGEPIIGLARLPITLAAAVGSRPEQKDIGWGNRLLYVHGREPVPFGPKMSAGDIISIKFNASRGTISFYRNNAHIGIAVGPEGSGAAVELELSSGSYHPVVSLCNVGDAVEFFSFHSASKRKVRKAGSIEKHLKVPDWLKPLKESISLLRSCALHEIPPQILQHQVLFIPPNSL
jgi:hypothetical protein